MNDDPRCPKLGSFFPKSQSTPHTYEQGRADGLEEHRAMVAAAYEAAAQIIQNMPSGYVSHASEIQGYIRTATPADARAALEGIRMQSEKTGWDKGKEAGRVTALHLLKGGATDEDDDRELVVALEAVKAQAGLTEHDFLCIPCANAVRSGAANARCGRGAVLESAQP